MKRSGTPGCVFALVDRQGLLWAEGFGWANPQEKQPAVPETVFKVLSLSKPLTTAAVLRAVQDGVLNLDAPITTYLPEFHANSRYEARPERKITLRHLLTHTSGLQPDAPVGNSAEPLGTFDEHVRSLSGTWLRFPVGQAARYSNAGVDLAAYALQAATGVPFEQYLWKEVLRPLGMTNSALGGSQAETSNNRFPIPVHTYSRSRPQAVAGGPPARSAELHSAVSQICNLPAATILQNGLQNTNTTSAQSSESTSLRLEQPCAPANAALGHSLGVLRTTFPGPLLASAGVRSSVLDLAQFVQMQINRGAHNGRPFIEEPLLRQMAVAYARKQPPDGTDTYFGLGVRLRRFYAPGSDRVDLVIHHGGGGAGFVGLMFWYPAYGLGGVALANRHPNPEMDDFPLRLATRLIDRRLVARREPPAWSQREELVGAWPVAPAAHSPTPYRAGWRQYCGRYRFRMTGYDFRWYARLAMWLGIGSVTPGIKIGERDGYLCVDESKFVGWVFGHRLRQAPLEEYCPGLFFTAQGDCLDFSGAVPTYNHLRLKRR